MKKLFTALKSAGQDFIDDECMASAAAIAYYTIFSLPPLLVLVFFTAGVFGVSQEQVARVAKEQVGIPVTSVSNPASGGVRSNAQESDSQSPESSNGSSASAGDLEAVAGRAQESTSPVSGLGPLSRIIGIALIIFSATGVFGQLQTALNRAWEVEPDPEQGGVFSFLMKRLLSLGMIAVIAFLLLVSLVVSAMVDEITGWVLGSSAGTVSTVVGMLVNMLITLSVATLLFAAMYKILPDANLQWRDTWIGAGMTALLFVIGKILISWYLQSAQAGADWGAAAGSLIAVLVWVYYTSLIVLFGAELTQVWANLHGRYIAPEAGAVKKKEEKRYVRE